MVRKSVEVSKVVLKRFKLIEAAYFTLVET